MNNLRPCELVFKKETIKAYFHGFFTEASIIAPSLFQGGHTGGNVSTCLALVEYPDGTMHRVAPEQVRFTDRDVIIKQNSDLDVVKAVRKALVENDGYCPCAVQRTEDTKCMCKDFREQQKPGPCKCGLYVKKLSE